MKVHKAIARHTDLLEAFPSQRQAPRKMGQVSCTARTKNWLAPRRDSGITTREKKIPIDVRFVITGNLAFGDFVTLLSSTQYISHHRDQRSDNRK